MDLSVFVGWSASAPSRCLPNGSTTKSTRKPFHVVGHQLPVDVNLGGLTLHGRLDRLDEIDDAHVVIDYKTGASNYVGAWQVPRPQLPQLPFYALAMERQKFNLAGVSFAVVRKGEAKFQRLLARKGSAAVPGPVPRSFEGLHSMSTPDAGLRSWSASPRHLCKATPRPIREFRREEMARLASIAIWRRCAVSANGGR